MFSASSSPPSSVHYELPVPIEESSMGEPTVEDQPVDDQPPSLTFEVVEGASKRGQQKLFDNRGYSYCVTGGEMRSHTGTVASEASPTTVQRQ